jgi:hypothetical protein
MVFMSCNSSMMHATSGAVTDYPSGAHEFTPGIWWGSCYSIFSFKCMFRRSLFVHLYFNHKFWNIVSTDIYTPYGGAAGMLLHVNGKFIMGKFKSSLLS